MKWLITLPKVIFPIVIRDARSKELEDYLFLCRRRGRGARIFFLFVSQCRRFRDYANKSKRCHRMCGVLELRYLLWGHPVFCTSRKKRRDMGSLGFFGGCSANTNIIVIVGIGWITSGSNGVKCLTCRLDFAHILPIGGNKAEVIFSHIT